MRLDEEHHPEAEDDQVVDLADEGDEVGIDLSQLPSAQAAGNTARARGGRLRSPASSVGEADALARGEVADAAGEAADAAGGVTPEGESGDGGHSDERESDEEGQGQGIHKVRIACAFGGLDAGAATDPSAFASG